mmetsp:Transcript_14315/g.27792  ORF Transcript_14315/g.27792 Transcript_14315/m.27792 type:complete len:232 (-) Transcript_14315:267-962(-)
MLHESCRSIRRLLPLRARSTLEDTHGAVKLKVRVRSSSVARSLADARLHVWHLLANSKVAGLLDNLPQITLWVRSIVKVRKESHLHLSISFAEAGLEFRVLGSDLLEPGRGVRAKGNALVLGQTQRASKADVCEGDGLRGKVETRNLAELGLETSIESLTGDDVLGDYVLVEFGKISSEKAVAGLLTGSEKVSADGMLAEEVVVLLNSKHRETLRQSNGDASSVYNLDGLA